MAGPLFKAGAKRRTAAWAVAASLLVLAPVSPVHAEYRPVAPPAGQSPSFEAAFAGFAMDAQDLVPEPTEVDAAEARFASAPVEESAEELIGVGIASYYGAAFAGRPTASGETFDPSTLTAAHRTLPFGSKVKVTNRRTGKSVVVRINDRGPFHGNRLIDLSREAAQRIGLIGPGKGTVELALLTS